MNIKPQSIKNSHTQVMAHKAHQYIFRANKINQVIFRHLSISLIAAPLKRTFNSSLQFVSDTGHNSARENHYTRPGNSDFERPSSPQPTLHAASHFQILYRHLSRVSPVASDSHLARISTLYPDT